MNTNRNYLADWAKAQSPIQGIDRNRGTDGRGNPSPIEDSIWNDDKGELVYINPIIRVLFFTDSVATAYHKRWIADTGMSARLVEDGDFNTSRDILGRKAYRLIGEGFNMPLSQLRHLASTGQDLNGLQSYTDKDYQISVDGPGTFSWTPYLDDPGGTPGFIPQRR